MDRGSTRLPVVADRASRRKFLEASIACAVTASLAGCLGTGEEDVEPEPADHEIDGLPISYYPYAGVDWEGVGHHKSEFHNHVRGGAPTPQDVIDTYHELGYTVYAAADKGDAPMIWPWTEIEDRRVTGGEENRDPGELGVVAFPGCEWVMTRHMSSIFSTLDHWGPSYDDHPDLTYDMLLIEDVGDIIELVVEMEDFHVPEDEGGMIVFAHPNRYNWTPEELTPYFDEWSREDGLIGLEVFHRTAVGQEDVERWDALLTEFAPDRMLWAFGVDDPAEYVLGDDLDHGWTTVLLDEDEFDPSNQDASRRAAARAYRDGRTLFHTRDRWDPETEEPGEVPELQSIQVDVDAEQLTVEASGYERIEWVSAGEVVSEEATIDISTDLAPYVRAHLYAARGETGTQAIGIADE